MQSPPFPRYLVPPGPKNSPQHHTIKNLNLFKGRLKLCIFSRNLKVLLPPQKFARTTYYYRRQEIIKHSAEIVSNFVMYINHISWKSVQRFELDINENRQHWNFASMTKTFFFERNKMGLCECIFCFHVPFSAVTVASRSKASVCGRSPVEIVGSNPTGGMDICLLWVLCVVK